MQASETFYVTMKGVNKSQNYDCFKPYSKNEGDFEVDVVENNRLDALEQKHGVPQIELRSYITLSDLRNSKSVVIMFKPRDKTSMPIVLGYSTKYEYQELREFIGECGFKIVEEYFGNARTPEKSTFGYFLLQKKPRLG